ncbi:hypothetical protein [Methylobacterium planeticum]|uniref:Uncharacterized protein n=1 Tax=Methylobacterium planeticum TaxID=2615211 RepID=A0A6N6MM24_9HYPH|nr:hypothetical protein [Methylobacterium planeticum]KAB1071156.1 hypothetical protein F6X51_19850 [Methylobacterium planeticum]
MQLTPRQIRIRLDRAVARAGTLRALALEAGISASQVGRHAKSGANVPDRLPQAAGMWRDAEGDVRDREPARIQIFAVQASGDAGVAAAVAMLGAALGQR